jgi:uncharacterized membrane protein (UPF0136 family)
MAYKGNFDTFALSYGTITLIGGLIGYFKANSYASYSSPAIPNPSIFPLIQIRLITSTVFSATIFYATTQLPPAQSARVMLAVGVILGLFFVRRFLESYKVMPAGLMTGLR